jgi:hypothetical protein
LFQSELGKKEVVDASCMNTANIHGRNENGPSMSTLGAHTEMGQEFENSAVLISFSALAYVLHQCL